MKNYRDRLIKIIGAVSRFLPYFPGKERILRFIYHPDKRQNDYLQTVISCDGNLKINIDTRSFIEWQIFFKGYYEKRIVNFIKTNCPPGGVFVDVGANVGCHSLIASKIATKVIAIEPVDYIRERLMENIKLNSVKNIVVYPVAISDYIGVASIYLPKRDSANKGTASLSCRETDGEEIKVPVTTLGELLKNEHRIDFIKIDVEEHNKEVIFGAKEIIKKFDPIVLYEDDKSDKMKIF
jgi:FkbM family methyltransferase